MNNLFFKSANRLIKNSSIEADVTVWFTDFARILNQIQKEQRYVRSDLQDINHKLDRLLVDKHLQMQVDEYFNDSNVVHPEDTRDID